MHSIHFPPRTHHRSKIVGKASAVPDHNIHGVMLHKTHLTLVKFSDISDSDYCEVVKRLQDCASDAQEEATRKHQARRDINSELNPNPID
jgi:hypothetical protein